MSSVNNFPFTEKTETFLNPLFGGSDGLFDFIDKNDTERNAAFFNSTAKCGTPDFLRDTARDTLQVVKDYDKIRKELAFLLPFMHDGGLTDGLMKKALGICSKHCFKIMKEFEDSGIRVFDSYTRGTKRYNKKIAAKTVDRVARMIKKKLHCICATMTCDPSEYGNDPLRAWEEWKDKLLRFLKELRRYYDFEYVVVMESTGKQYPHAHIVMGFKDEPQKGFDKIKGGQMIKYGSFIEKVKRFRPARIFCIKKLGDKNAAWYLSKYISKFDTNDFFKLAKKEGHFTKEERKAIYCYLYTIMAKVRQFQFSKHECDSNAEEQKELFSEEVTKQVENKSSPATVSQENSGASFVAPTDDPRWWKNADACVRYLIERWINLPKSCLAKIFIMHDNRYFNLFGYKDDKEVESGYYDVKKFQENGKCLGCNGCFYTHIGSFLKGLDDWVINFSYWDIDGERKRWFDDCDLLDSEDFMAHFKSAVKFIMRYLYQNKMNIRDFELYSLKWGFNMYLLPWVDCDIEAMQKQEKWETKKR